MGCSYPFLCSRFQARAAQGLISAYSHTNDKKAVLLRFANIICPFNGHGVISDFISQVKNDPRTLIILADGYQRKSYLHIEDSVTAVQKATEVAEDGVSVFNIGSEDELEVRIIATILAEEANLKNKTFDFAGGSWRLERRCQRYALRRQQTKIKWMGAEAHQ